LAGVFWAGGDEASKSRIRQMRMRPAPLLSAREEGVAPVVHWRE
jgi:hypothetical protein